MHWFWRALIAFGAGWGVHFLAQFAILFVVRTRSIQAAVPFVQVITIAGFSLCLVVSLTVYGVLTRRTDARRIYARETCCRQCGYVLRGISEPRCPECGERI